MGRSGGLLLLWREPVSFSLCSFSRFHIEGWVADEDGVRSRFLGLYGDPVASNRKFSWDLIRRVLASFQGPWLVGGDLNEVAHDSELSHGRRRDTYLVDAFRHMLEDCDLEDLGFEGPTFTWRKSSDPDSVEERLDRCLVNAEWRNYYPNAKVLHLEYWNSDHRPLLLASKGRTSGYPPRAPRRFSSRKRGVARRSVRTGFDRLGPRARVRGSRRSLSCFGDVGRISGHGGEIGSRG